MLLIFDIKQFLMLDKVRKVMRIPSQIIFFVLALSIYLAFKIAELITDATASFDCFCHISDFEQIYFAISIFLMDGSHVLMFQQDQ